MPYRPEWLSLGAEILVAELEQDQTKVFDVVVVGSGYGGAVAAARLAGARKADGSPVEVLVLERGREYVPGTFPSRFSDLPGHIRLNRYDDPKAKGKLDGLFDFRIGRNVNVLVGNGLGGGSLINAAVAERPHDDVFDDAAWPDAIRRDLAGLKACFAKAEGMLGANPAQTAGLAKYDALNTLAAALGKKARPVNIAIQSGDNVNPQGIQQHACIRCGDCVTGCNFWAKNTLAMNYLAAARRQRARLFTNAAVSHVQKGNPADGEHFWLVHFHLTGERHPPLKPEERIVRARHVILAAGTLGSTEILMRSRMKKLRMSAELGKRFSSNGDMISVLHGQKNKVNAAPEESVAFKDRKTGPTITGIIESGSTRDERIVIEELAVPGALRRVFEEVVTTGALPVRLEKFDWGVHGPNGHDPLAVNPDAIERSQVFAAMGDDGAEGRLELIEGWEGTLSDGAIRVDWKDAADAPVFERQDSILSRAEKLDGIYLRSPLWKLLPDGISKMLSGKQPGKTLLSVHPLGGCPMGNNAEKGVVDDLGRVFDTSDDDQRARVYDGLLVLDGSIIPVALGINPLLTITALAERAISAYARIQDWTIDTPVPADLLPAPPDLPAPVTPPPAHTVIRFAERMTGELKLAPNRPATAATLEVVFGEIGKNGGIPAFLRDGPHQVELAQATLTLDGAAAVPLSGVVYWMARGRTFPFCRALHALVAWIRLRAIADWFQRKRLKGLWEAIKAFVQGGSILALASNVGEIRHLRYDMKLMADLPLGNGAVLPKGTAIEGLKTVQYTVGGNPWKQLSNLVVTVKHNGSHEAGTLKIDINHLVQRFATQFQIAGQLDQPSAMMDIASIGLFMARILIKTHFWSFRAPEYESFDPDRARRRLPGELAGLSMQREAVSVIARKGEERLVLPLTHYWKNPDSGLPPVLIVHGFGASGAQFAHPKMERNLVRHLAESNRDVWVAELRTSIALPSSFSQWTLDEVACEDIRAIVDTVLGKTGKPQLDVVAHCIGSAMFCTAALDGKLAVGSQSNPISLVHRAVLLQVGPLITLSTGNRFRGYLTAALRKYMLTDHVDSSVDDRANATNTLVDRLLYTYPYPDAEQPHHALWPPCKPHTHIANCNRSAAVFGRLFDHANMNTTMLDALGDLLGHINLRTAEQTAQYAFLRRLTDYNASNSYVSDENVRKHFTFPVRFLHGEHNDVFHPETTIRSLALLKDVFGKNHPADRILIRGYGHLDPLIGNDAETNVFRHISEWLAQSSAPAPRPPAYAAIDRRKYPKRPLIGPVLGWTRQDNGVWKIRIWCRTNDEQSYAYFLIAVVVDGTGKPVPGYTCKIPLIAPQGGDNLGDLDLLGVIDVKLPPAPDDYEIVVVGAHASTESNMSSDDVAPLPDAVEQSPPLESSDLDLKAALAEPAKTTPLPDSYGEAVLAERVRWTPAVAAANTAQRTCDPGYEEQLDSVRISRSLMERLTPGNALCFALASCRYTATLLDREQADIMFGTLRKLLDGPQAPSLLLLAGDQIYTDATAGMFDPKNQRNRCYDAYREAWTAPHARAVLRQLPTYMMMDDHEVGNDWHPDDPESSQLPIREWGLRAFEDYQHSHSPQNAATLCAAAGVAPPEPAYFYAFESGGFPFFVCDTRSNRIERRQIMASAQFAALKKWLIQQESTQGSKPKFVMSPSVVTPFLKATQGHAAYAPRSDGWDGFPGSLRDLFDFIAAHSIRNVVFLCGDPHISIISEISIRRGQAAELRGLCVIASPLYAPFPFANNQPIEFLMNNENTPLALPGGATMRYSCKNENMRGGDSFTLIDVKQHDGHWRVTANVYGKDIPPHPTCFDLPG